MRRLLVLVTILALGAPPLACAESVDIPLPTALYSAVPNLHLLGAGQLDWFLFHVYDAALYVSGKDYEPAAEPFALAIRYDRSFSSAQLAKTSLREMDRLSHPDPALREEFARELRQAFPSVHSGDELVGLCVPQQYTAFYFDGKLYSKIDDPKFCPAFFGIWLDPRTRVPGLRKKLLGLHD
ncbi:hypothetical protein HFU84_03655 [Acidithiobacillus sp. CV18-2]|uniref:Chalcone isomerase domain-containing protein n=1 Tax=Igneacidithiobacillus copahuensis TaxID=2724909 RepID=A0AAE2YQK9_9PROT|nr:chalcone isomerase family protein [Igneacidithiobacillus copahuensis]MBU2753127.1 hypothetical protein [Acidithiobacillus sp. CV18-3]MBU2756725.1 hypothetical protein [Acidithiobacillus sp. BN09-2]MBU2776610.1 hypothetical protein [Acidithiobacillus sp. CV18-2]MBU2796983.1 hypothetical protein [Acidithiobacillus sp. VAN18-2]MBU2798211.1 hypothetical protein [Acidithiobacillus sp. VAN18-4]UTV80466.1 chalcone isomerase family protein [Acidithiobacillus sp. YTS05]